VTNDETRRNDVIEMARQVGLVTWLSNSTFTDGRWWIEAHEAGEELEAFAKLVAAKEREACAGLCDRFANRMMDAEECADAIRARGEA
jgi:hypothetical protein